MDGKSQSEGVKLAAGRRLDRRPGLVLDRQIAAGARAYDRLRDLPGLTRLDPGIIESAAEAARKLIVARLAAALRAERNRARSGHWTYDLNRHIALRQAYLAESTSLRDPQPF